MKNGRQWVLTSVGGKLEVKLLVAETKVLGGHEAREEDIDTFAHRERHGNHAVGRGGAVQHTNIICR
jgi:hypothetical protein